MARADIAWVRADADGEKLQVYAPQVGTRWDFFCRPGRHDDWQALEEPSLEDWLNVLDGVRRRLPRRQYRLVDVEQLEALIRKRFPHAEL